MITIELAKPVAKKLKVLLYGTSGSGKTLAALSFPRALMFDTESGSDLYAGRQGVPPFHRVRGKTMSDLNEVLTAIEADAGKTWDTLIIDPVTVLYDVEKNVASVNYTKDLGFREWAKVNARMAALYNRLTNLNVHVVIIAREATEYAGEGTNLRKIGVKPEADKKLTSMMDFVIHLNSNHSADVEKSRGVTLGQNGHLQSVSWDVFAPIALLYIDGVRQSYEDDEQSADRESDSLQDRDNAADFIKYWRGQGVTDKDVLSALGVSRLSEWTDGRKAADKEIAAYINDMMGTKPAQPKTAGEADASH